MTSGPTRAVARSAQRWPALGLLLAALLLGGAPTASLAGAAPALTTAQASVGVDSPTAGRQSGPVTRAPSPAMQISTTVGAWGGGLGAAVVPSSWTPPAAAPSTQLSASTTQVSATAPRLRRDRAPPGR